MKKQNFLVIIPLVIFPLYTQADNFRIIFDFPMPALTELSGGENEKTNDIAALYNDWIEDTRGVSYIDNISPIQDPYADDNLKKYSWRGGRLPNSRFNSAIAISPNTDYVVVGDMRESQAVTTRFRDNVESYIINSRDSGEHFPEFLDDGDYVVFNENIKFYQAPSNGLITENNFPTNDDIQSTSVMEDGSFIVATRNQIFGINSSKENISDEKRVLWEHDVKYISIDEIETDSFGNIYYATLNREIVKLDSNRNIVWKTQIPESHFIDGLAIYES